MSDMQHLILDFDGVIGDTDEACHLCHMFLNPNLTLEQAKAKHIEYFMDTRHCLQKGGLDPEEGNRKEVFARYVFHLGKVFEGFINELKKLQSTKMAIVSSGTSLYLNKLLKPYADDNLFDFVLGYDAHSSKEVKIKKVCECWNSNTDDVFYLTDTRSDVIEVARILPVPNILGVSWGTHSLEILAGLLGKEKVLTEFAHIHRFFS